MPILARLITRACNFPWLGSHGKVHEPWHQQQQADPSYVQRAHGVICRGVVFIFSICRHLWGILKALIYFCHRPVAIRHQRLLSGIRTANRSIPLLGRFSTPLPHGQANRTHWSRSTVVFKFAESALECHRFRRQRDCVSTPNIFPFN